MNEKGIIKAGEHIILIGQTRIAPVVLNQPPKEREIVANSLNEPFMENKNNKSITNTFPSKKK
jgi:hypothetical protein